MERIRQKREVSTSTFQRPRFPHLKAKDNFEILQYEIGRKEIIEKINHIAWKFKYYLEPMVKPIISDNTEPYTILRWYYDAAKEIIETYQLDNNLDQYINNIDSIDWLSEEENSKIDLWHEHYEHEIWVIGIKWVHKTPVKYWKHFYNIFREVEQFGTYTIWDYLSDWDPEENIKDEIQHYTTNDQHDEEREYLQQQLKDIKEIKDNYIDWSNLVRTELPVPENEFEKALNCRIEECHKILDSLKGFNFSSGMNEDDYNNSLLPTEQLYNIVLNGSDPTVFTQVNYIEQHVESLANQAGVAPWRFYYPWDSPFEDSDTQEYRIHEVHELFTILTKWENGDV